MNPTQAQTTRRVPALDGLRGWLALAVVLSHVVIWRWFPVPGAGPAPDGLTWTLWNIGAPSVDAFFVLSGLVVGRSLIHRHRPYAQYLGERATRLLPVGGVGIALGLAAHAAAPLLGHSDIASLLQSPFTPGDWAGILTLGLLPFDANRLNPPLWSLIVEQHIALLMPALVWLLTRKRLGLGTAAAIILTVAFAGLMLGFSVKSLGSLWFLPAFALGVTIRNARVPTRWVWPLMITGTVIWQHRLFSEDTLFSRVPGAVGAVMLIAGLCSLNRDVWLSRVLTCAPSQWLGRVSYSLYATHFPVLMIGALLLPTQPSVGAALMVIPALGFAALVWKLVEHPSTEWKARRTRQAALREVH